MVFFIPWSVDLTMKESKGDGISRDLCRRLIMFKYCGMDLYCNDLASNTAYRGIRSESAETRGTPNTLQKAE